MKVKINFVMGNRAKLSRRNYKLMSINKGIKLRNPKYIPYKCKQVKANERRLKQINKGILKITKNG